MASIGADLGLFDLPRSVPKNRASAARVGQTSGVKEDVLLPIVTRLEQALDGEGFELNGARGVTAEHPLSTIRVFARTADASYVFEGVEAWRLFNKAGAIKTWADLDLPLDGTTDCTDALNAGLAPGNVTILIDLPQIRIDGRVLLQDGCQLAFGAGCRQVLGKDGRFRANGFWSEAYGPEDSLALTVAVSAGATSVEVETSSQGGSDVSGLLVVGERITLRDTSGQVHEAKVTGITDPSGVNFTPAVGFDLPLDSRLDLIQTLHLDGGAAAGATFLTVRADEMTRVSLYRYVAVMDDSSAGAATGHKLEIAQVVGIELDGANTIRLDRPLRRSFAALSDARAQVMEPVVGARLIGCNVEYGEAPNDVGRDTFGQLYTIDCTFEALRVGNEDLFGTRGAAFRTERSLRSGYRDCWAMRPKYTGGGEGIGWACRQSTECFFERGVLDGCRHSISYDASTDCWSELLSSKRPAVSHVDYSSRGEHNCWVRGAWLEGGPSGFVFGDPTSHGGCFDCFGRDIVSLSPTGEHVLVLAGAERCGVADFTFRGGIAALSAQDVLSDSSLEARDNYLENGRVFSTSDWAINIDGGIQNGASRAVVRQRVSNVEFAGCAKQFYTRRCSAAILDETEVRDPIIPPPDDYALRGQDCPGLVVRQSVWTGVRKGLNLTNATNGRIYRNAWVDWNGGTQEYADGGGNTGLVGADNVAVGFTKTGVLPI